jgi:hypothetical protein
MTKNDAAFALRNVSIIKVAYATGKQMLTCSQKDLRNIWTISKHLIAGKTPLGHISKHLIAGKTPLGHISNQKTPQKETRQSLQKKKKSQGKAGV